MIKSIHEVMEDVGLDLVTAGVDFNDLSIGEDGQSKITVTWSAVQGSSFAVNFDLDISDEYLAGPSAKQVTGMERAVADIAKRIADEVANYGEEICQFWFLRISLDGEEEYGPVELWVDMEDMVQEMKIQLTQRARVASGRTVMTRAEFDEAKALEAVK